VSENFLIGEYLTNLQARARLHVHFAYLANTLLKDEKRARDNHVLSQIFTFFKTSLADSAINLSFQ